MAFFVVSEELKFLNELPKNIFLSKKSFTNEIRITNISLLTILAF